MVRFIGVWAKRIGQKWPWLLIIGFYKLAEDRGLSWVNERLDGSREGIMGILGTFLDVLPIVTWAAVPIVLVGLLVRTWKATSLSSQTKDTVEPHPSLGAPALPRHQYSKEILVVSSLVSRPSPIIMDRIFKNCTLVGPAVILFADSCEVHGSRFDVGLDVLLIDIAANRRLSGVIIFDRCTFDGCRFEGLGIAITPAQREIFEQAVPKIQG